MDLEPVYFYFSSILILFISFYGLQGMYLYIQERENKITTRIKTSQVALSTIIIGKWISLSLFLFIQGSIVLLICMSLKLFSSSINIRLGLFFILIICSCIASLTLLITSFSKNDYIGSISIFCISILGIFLGGGIVPYSYLPRFVEQFGKLTFNHWAIQGLIYSLFDNDYYIVWQSGLVITGLTIAFLAIIYGRLLWEDNRI